MFFTTCLNMFNNIEHQSLHTSSMDPRISFSNDFADAREAIKFESSYREAPVSSDFEFSVRNYCMIPADEIFCEGKILPLKDNSSNQLRRMTLRDELLVGGDDGDEFDIFHRVKNSSAWWKERLGLKTKKGERNNGVSGRIVEEKRTIFLHDKGVADKSIGSIGYLNAIRNGEDGNGGKDKFVGYKV